MAGTFLDVGAHRGQTIEAVVGRFDRIVAFEPMPTEYAALREAWGETPVVELHNYGLHDFTGVVHMYGDNAQMEASVYPDKVDLDARVVTHASFVRATAWFMENVAIDESPVVKLNCEGSECAIVNDLIDSGYLWRIANVMIDFDVRKIPSMAHQETELRARLAGIGFDRVSYSDDVMVGETHADRIRHWLDGIGH